MKRQASNAAKTKTSNISRLPSNGIPSGFPSAFSGTRTTLSEANALAFATQTQVEPLGTLHSALGEQKGTPGVTAASPSRGLEPAAMGRPFGWTMLFNRRSAFLGATTEPRQEVTRRHGAYGFPPCVSAKFLDTSEGVSGLLAPGHHWGEEKGEATGDRDLPEWTQCVQPPRDY